MKKKQRIENMIEALANLGEFKVEDYLTTRKARNAFMAEAMKTGDSAYIQCALETVIRAEKRK
jgi:DNA-binding phage protein